MAFLIGYLIGLALFFIPFIIAKARGHKHTTAVFVANLLCGLVPFGWVIVLIWAFV
jgi:hypothetical protein